MTSRSQVQYPALTCRFFTSMDTTTTTGHRQLLNSLRDLRLALLNGRTTPELSCAFTNTITLGQSTIDYAIANSSCATSIKSLKVCSGLGRLASQLYAGGRYGALGHAPLLLELSLCLPTTATPAGTSHGPVFRWRSLPTWVDHLASPHFQQQLASLSATLDRPGLCLTTFMDQFTALLRQEAHKVFPKPFSPHPSSRHKPWFDHECRQAHKTIKQALREGAPPPALQQARRVFKSLVRRKKNMHTIAHIEKLIKLKYEEYGRRFWRTLNRRPTQHHSLPLNAFMDHFTQLLTRSGEPPPLPSTLLHPHHHHTQLTNMEALTSPLDQDDIITALRRCNNNTSPGPGGLPIEILKYARLEPQHPDDPPTFILAPILTKLFNRLSALPQLPPSLSTSHLLPLLKDSTKDLTSPSNYRGISIVPTITKIYIKCWEHRLYNFTESSHLRSDSQFGFRTNRRTTDAIFILNTLIEQAQHLRRPLYVCFVDLRKAYDTVVHRFLWGRLCKIGIEGQLLLAFQRYYSDVQARLITSNGQLSPETIHQDIGVKQGCPASCTLFGIFIDELISFLEHKCPNQGASLLDTTITNIFFADDFALTADSTRDLQALVDATCEWVQAFHMQVSTEKTKVMAFTAPGVRRPVMRISAYRGTAHQTQLGQASSFRYLGCHLHQTKGIASHISTLHASGFRASLSLSSKCSQAGMHHPRVKGPELFRCLVLPVLMYGCEVWGPTFNTFHLGGHLAAMRRAAGPRNPETLQLNFYRHLFGLRKTTPPSTILLETASTTIQYHWWALIIAYWNRLISTHHSPLLRAAFQASLELSKHTSACWAARVRQGVASLGLDPGTPHQPLQVIQPHLLDAIYTTQLPPISTPHPRHTHPPSGRMCTAYEAWFRPLRGHCAPHLNINTLHPTKLTTMSRFRLGSHHLRVTTGAWTQPPMPLAQRTCRFCGGAIEDARHLLLECEHEELRTLRRGLPSPYGHQQREDRDEDEQCTRGRSGVTELEELRRRAVDGDLDAHMRWLFVGADQRAVADVVVRLVLMTA